MTEEKNALTEDRLEGETINNQKAKGEKVQDEIQPETQPEQEISEQKTKDSEEEVQDEISIEEQKEQEKKDILLRISPGMVVKVYQKIIETDPKGNPKERVQAFEGTVIARKGGSEAGATFMVRKMAAGHVGVEKIFPIDLPTILKVEILKEHKIRRSKLYFLRNFKRKLKEIKKK